MVTVIRAADLAPEPEETARVLEGDGIGSPVSFVCGTADGPGFGPPMHRHDYVEIHIVREGRVRFVVEGETIEAAAGDVVVVPAGAAHSLVTLGPGRTSDIGIHLSPKAGIEVVGPPLTLED